MRQELTETELIEKYLSGEITADVETRRVLDAAFAEKVEHQRTAYRMIRVFARDRRRRRMEKIFLQLMQEPVFAQQIKSIF